MVTIPHISQNIFYIILAAIAVVALLIIILQWRRVRASSNNVKFLTKEAELRKIQLVERDIRSYQNIKSNDNPKNHSFNLPKIYTSDLMKKMGYLNNEINTRTNHLESTTEYRKIQTLIRDIDEKEDAIKKKAERVKG
jgi:hypothetical protein